MRTIKFRAWDYGKKEWLLGYEYPNLGGFSLDGECVLMGEWANVCTSFMFEKDNRKRTDLKLMQFTGQKDKNGKEIYEGDILKSECGKLGKIEWLNNRTAFCVHWYLQLGSGDIEYCVLNLKLEIIGNIYENPELLSTPTAVL